jgi:hypothetical protein
MPEYTLPAIAASLAAAFGVNCSGKAIKNLPGPTRAELYFNSQVVTDFYSQNQPEQDFVAAARVGRIHANDATLPNFLTITSMRKTTS